MGEARCPGEDGRGPGAGPGDVSGAWPRRGWSGCIGSEPPPAGSELLSAWAPHRQPGLVTLVGCLSTGPSYKSGFLKMKGFLCVIVEQRNRKDF